MDWCKGMQTTKTDEFSEKFGLENLSFDKKNLYFKRIMYVPSGNFNMEQDSQYFHFFHCIATASDPDKEEDGEADGDIVPTWSETNCEFSIIQRLVIELKYPINQNARS